MVAVLAAIGLDRLVQRGIGGTSHAVALMRRRRVRLEHTNMATNPTPTTPPDPFAKGEMPEELKKAIDAIRPEPTSVPREVEPSAGDLPRKA
jgi:hypothetical protein